VEKAKAFLDAAGKAAAEAGREAHLLVHCSPDRERARAAERALLRRPAPSPGRRDPVLDALPLLLPKLAEESSGLYSRNIQLTTGVALSREEGAKPRLVLRLGSLRLSVPVPAETVEALVDPVVAWHFPRAYKDAAAGGTVRLASFLSDNTLEIKAGARRLLLYAYPTDDLPRCPRASEGEGEVSYAAGDLGRAIDRVLPFASRDETRPVLTAVRIEGRGGGTRLVATDSYRMICDDTLRGTAPPKDAAAVVKAGDLRLLSRLLARSEPEARVALALVREGAELVASGALADATTYEAVWRPVDGRYPECEKLLPDEAELARFGLPAEETLGALEASSAMRSDQGVDPVVVAFGRASATIAVETEGGAFSQTMEAIVPEGAAVRAVAVNPANLAAALRARAGGGRMAWLGLNQDPEHAPWTLRPVAVGKDMAVMPMRQPRLGQR
jgi:DNA polymerase-3 subunit beta